MPALVDAALGAGRECPRRVLKERRLWLVLALVGGGRPGRGAVALIAAYFVRFRADMIPAPLGIPPIEPYLSSWRRSCRSTRSRSGRSASTSTATSGPRPTRPSLVLQGATLATLLLVASTFFFRTFSYSRWFILVFWASRRRLPSSASGSRSATWCGRSGATAASSAAPSSSGAGPLGQEVVRRLRGHPEFGVRVVGYLDDRIPVGRAHRGQGGPRGLRGGHARARRLPGGPALRGAAA